MPDLIYNQHLIPEDEWRYGLRPSGATGCGWIAVYNALALMNYRMTPEDLIRYFELQLPMIHGNLGTSIPGLVLFFKQRKFPVRTAADRRKFDELAKESDVCILFYRWRKKWKLGAHFVALQYRDGCFTGYNTYKNSTGPDDYGESLEDFLKDRGWFGPVLIGIRDKRKKCGKNTVDGV